VYQLKGGNLICLLRTGLNLGQGQTLRNLGFGTLAAADGGAVALIGYLTDSGKAELLISNGRTRVLAVVGQKTPDGVRYRDLGPPSVSGSNGFAFAALTDGGARVYENEEGNLRVALTAGSGCGEGKISYMSQDRVGLNSDGSITVAGSCSGAPALFLVSNSHPTMLVGTGSGVLIQSSSTSPCRACLTTGASCSVHLPEREARVCIRFVLSPARQTCPGLLCHCFPP
jgi:hypothetical protein